MRHRLLIAMTAGALAAAVAGTSACDRGTAAVQPGAAQPATVPPGSVEPGAGAASAGAQPADIYIAVLRRYLGTPGENSFPESFATAYVLDRAVTDAGDPMSSNEPAALIEPGARQRMTAALAATTRIVFVADRQSVMETTGGCEQVKAGGILITLGPAVGDEHEVKVAVNGFVACLGATWLTYVVHNEPDAGWRVTGTTGTMAIA